MVGNIIHCKNHKSRLTVENKMVDVRLSYSDGLDRYYGLLELAEKHGILKKVSTVSNCLMVLNSLKTIRMTLRHTLLMRL